ncbi:hypothetical protein M513_00097 [Trichuris suis]|uniref:Uncharacterized protein n=1 Tax=Trichuris suis TaxID=68888 RepID=A0A085MNY8_9BILA|nr:hypothetical protein M513_00097 [Trichuris suis]
MPGGVTFFPGKHVTGAFEPLGAKGGSDVQPGLSGAQLPHCYFQDAGEIGWINVCNSAGWCDPASRRRLLP